MIEYKGEKFQEWLKKYVKDNKISSIEAREMLGLSNTSYYSLFKSKNLSRESVNRITSAFGVTEEEIWGSGSLADQMSRVKSDIERVINNTSAFKHTKENLWIVPFKSYAGFLRGYGDGIGTYNNIEKIYYPLIKGESFAFQIGGQSAYPLFPENTWFCGKPLDTPDDLVKGRLYTWQTVDGIVTKIFDGMDDEYFYISSVNPDYNPVEPFHRKDVKVIYRQVGKLDSFES
ncbi:hypothetical protein [Sphingobacterium sp.]|uniref:hypothetical protein n=1 Tax=Sphingobacterium sp. TaxID=341027 RepID=UPI0028AE4A21|nr:hypothetical protein [Sphingobacterium sp.]